MKACFNRKKSVPYAFLLPSLTGVTVFLLIPYADVFRRAFMTIGGEFAGVSNFIKVINNEAFLLAMKNTFLFMGLCIPVLMILSLAIAIYIFDNPKWSSFFKTGFLIPMAIPVASAVLLWKMLFDYGGILNGILTASGHDPVNFMESSAAFFILVGSYIWKNLGYSIILWLAALATMNRSSLEAAKLDGAGSIKAHLYVTMPYLKTSAFVIAVLSLLNSFKVFREAYLVAGDYPHKSIYLIQHLFNNWFRNLELDKIAAASVIDSVILIILIILLQYAWGREERK